jgi:hypothetical protein
MPHDLIAVAGRYRAALTAAFTPDGGMAIRGAYARPPGY